MVQRGLQHPRVDLIPAGGFVIELEGKPESGKGWQAGRGGVASGISNLALRLVRIMMTPVPSLSLVKNTNQILQHWLLEDP